MPVQHCLNCESQKFEVTYQGPIRLGSWGKESKESWDVIACAKCGLTRLAEFPDQEKFYQSSEYRDAYNGTADVRDYFRLHDGEQSERIARIGVEKFRDVRVLDYGCGGGSFLDTVKGVAAKTHAIEPCKEFHRSLKERGHTVFENAETAVKELRGSIDLIVSFGVIEHVPNPLSYLQTIYDLLKPGCSAYIETDNLDELLMKVDLPEFKKFFYRSAHLWYFTAKTLSALCDKAKLQINSTGFRHTYDISNALLWLKDRKPTGLGKLELFDPRANQDWRTILEASGMGDLICLQVTKSA